MDISERITQFIVDNFLFGDTSITFTPDKALLDSGILDSTGVIELVLFLSDEFGLEVPPEDMLPQYFNTIASLTAYVQQRIPVETTL